MAEELGTNAPEPQNTPKAETSKDEVYAAALAALAEDDSTDETPETSGKPLFPAPDEGDGAREALAALSSLPSIAVEEPAAGAAGDTVVSPAPLAASESSFAPGFEEPRRKGRAGIVAGVILVLALFVGAAYMGGVYYFEDRFLPGTTLDGHDVSLLTVEEAATFASDELEGYPTHVEGIGLDLDLSAAEGGLTIDTLGEAQAAHDQFDLWHWPLDIMESHALTTPHVTAVDETQLAHALEGPLADVNEGGIVPQNATTAFDEASLSFVVVPEVLGTTVDEAKVLERVKDALLALEPTVTLDDDCLARPTVLSDDEQLIEAVAAANALIAPVTLTHDGKEVDTITTETLMQWVTLDDDLNVSFDTSQLVAWARGPFSEAHDTIGTKRSYTREDGRKFTVEGGTYGWCVDGASLAEELAQRLESGSREPIEIPTLYEADVWVPLGQRDWGDTYIDLDLTEQHMRYYVDGKVVLESDVVTGKVSDGHPTPTGVYYINGNKATKQHLVGRDEDHDNKPDYENDVDWWMPFVNNMVAFHDAPWRSQFGGQIYYDNGSHGCVNLPPEVAKKLYELAPEGTVVVVHD